MVAISKAKIKEKNSSKFWRLVGRNVLIAVVFVLLIRLIRKVENKEIHFKLRHGNKEYIAKVKVGNVTQRANELYDAIFNTDREKNFDTLFAQPGNAATSEEVSTSAAEPAAIEAPPVKPAEPEAQVPAVVEQPKAEVAPPKPSGGFSVKKSPDQSVPPGIPPKCTADQMKRLQEQLPSDTCRTPNNQQCSYSKATKCHEPAVFKTYHMWNHVPSEFTAVFIGCNQGMDAVETLRLGAWDKQYSESAWNKKLQEGLGAKAKTLANCFGEVSLAKNSKNSGNVRPAQVYCFEPPSDIVDELKRAVTDLKWDSNLHVDSNTLATVSLDEYVQQNAALAKAPWIHFLSIGSFGYDFTVLQRAEKTLEKVAYLEFELTWKGDWAKQNFKEAIDWLMYRDFVCYWPGQSGNVWKITGCWQDMYDKRSWSHVACVNTRFPDPIMKNNMEKAFGSTLEKNIKF